MDLLMPSEAKPAGRNHSPFSNVLGLLPHELLESVCNLRIRTSFVIVSSAVVEDQLEIPGEVLEARIQVVAHTLLMVDRSIGSFTTL